nr:reverse transcriptase domain-containing protein [Tanacetum cinerariifolium]
MPKVPYYHGPLITYERTQILWIDLSGLTNPICVSRIVLSLIDSRDFFPPGEISPPKDAETPVESSILVSRSSLIGSSSPVMSITPPPDYPFDESIFTKLDNSLWIISPPLGGEPDPEEPNEIPPKRTSTSEAPAMTQAIIKKLVANSVSATLEAQAANMENTDNTTRPRETHVARKCTYKEFISCQPFYFNEQADKIAWTELKRILTNKYCPRTEVKKMEDEFYNLVVKGNDLNTYSRRFLELILLCPNKVPNYEKLIEIFIKGLPRCIAGNVTASKPQTLEEAINITQRLMDQVTKHNYVQETNNHKQKFDDSKNTSNNNTPIIVTTTTTPIITPMLLTTITTPTIATTTNTKITTTITTVTMITTNRRIGNTKPSGLLLPLMGIQEIVPYVKDAP